MRNKNLSLLILLPVVAAAVAEYFAILSSNASSYVIEALTPVMQMTESAMILLVVVYLAGLYLNGRIAMYAVRIVARVLLSVCFYQVLEQRATLIGYVWFSDL